MLVLRLALIVVAVCGLSAFAAPAARADRTSLVLVRTPGGRADVARLVSADLDLAEGTDRREVEVVLHGAADRRRLRALGLPVRVRVGDLAAAERAREARAALRPRAAASGLPSGRTRYRGLHANYQAELERLVADHLGLVRRVVLPRRSLLGQEIAGVEIARDVERDDDGRPVLLVLGAHHAREWPSAEVTQELGLDLVERYVAGDARVDLLLARARVVVVPVVNPDGYDVSRAAGRGLSDLEAGAYRRKNCRDDPADARRQSDPCSRLAGVDLNRNYAASWGGNGAGRTFSSPTFRGPAPFSEPETEAVRELLSSRQVTTLITNHNFDGGVLPRRGAGGRGRAPDEPALAALGRAMADATGYRSQLGYELYEATGTTEDWSYAALGTFGYTIEIGGDDFHGDYQDGVVDEYLGTAVGPRNRRSAGARGLRYRARPTGRGLREAFLLAGEQAADPRGHAVLAGTAPPGRLLRLTKRFTTATSPVASQEDDPTPTPAILVADRVETTLRVGASGRFRWHVNPSSRPFARRAGRREAWTLTCQAASGAVERTVSVVVDRGDAVDGLQPCGPSASPAATVVAPGSSAPVRGGRPATGAVVLVDRPSARALSRRARLRVQLRASAAELRAVEATLRAAGRRVVARAAAPRLAPGGTLVLRLRQRLRPGLHRLRLVGRTRDGRRRAATLLVRLRR